MNFKHAFFSAVHFFIVVFLFGAGIFFLGIPKAPKLRDFFVRLFSQEYELFTLIGASTLFLALILTLGFYAMHRGQFYKLKMTKHDAAINVSLIRNYVEKYWEMEFPKEKCTVEVFLTLKQEIHITAEMPHIPLKAQRKFLQKAEEELGEIFAKNLGYKQPFYFTVVT